MSASLRVQEGDLGKTAEARRRRTLGRATATTSLTLMRPQVPRAKRCVSHVLFIWLLEFWQSAGAGALRSTACAYTPRLTNLTPLLGAGDVLLRPALGRQDDDHVRKVSAVAAWGMHFPLASLRRVCCGASRMTRGDVIGNACMLSRPPSRAVFAYTATHAHALFA